MKNHTLHSKLSRGMSFLTMMTFLVACSLSAAAQNYIGDKNDIERILDNISKFSSYVMDSNYGEIAACYTKDAKIFPENSDIIEGQEPIRKYWVLPENVKITHHKIRPKEIKIIGNEAYDYGYYEGTTQTADGKKRSWEGKYVIVWRKEGADWKIYLDIWNRLGR
ncbi:YybH family protein [Spongiimicrobium salis]|uniref:YybH family protein n=1 Tax=Spongiimicrobium salis TaxID=1667022 RepID=UPI00374DD44E